EASAGRGKRYSQSSGFSFSWRKIWVIETSAMPERTENSHATPFKGKMTRLVSMMANRPNRSAASLEIRDVGIRSIPCGFVRDFALRPRGREHVVDSLNDTAWQLAVLTGDEQKFIRQRDN